MIIGQSRIGIGRLGIRSGNYSELSLTTDAHILGQMLASLTTNAQLVDIYALLLETSAEILDGYQRTFTTNASILAAIDHALETNANIADLIALALTTNAYIVQAIALALTTNASILGPVVANVTTNASICAAIDATLPTNAYICEQTPLALPTNAYISEYATPSLTTNAQIALATLSALSTNADILHVGYWAIGPEGSLVATTGRVADPQPKGFGLQTSRQRIPGSRRSILRDEGIDGPEYGFSVYFLTDSARAAFQAAVHNDAEDLQLFAGRSDRFYYVDRVAVGPLKDSRYGGPAQKITCYLEDPSLYFWQDQGIDLGACPLPQATASVYNYGNLASPLLFRIGGFYSSGQLTAPYIACMDGATQETSLCLGAGLLSGEYAELTREGAQKYFLRHTYADDYSTNNWWQYDASQSLCSLSGGQVSVPAGGWFYYKFQGQPLKDDIELTAAITKSGSPIVQYSTDGATWYTALAATEIISGVQKLYYLSGTEKKSTVYVRFYSPVGSSMTVQDVSFSMDRDISAQADQISSVPAGESRTLYITGSGSSKGKVKTSFRSRWQAQ